MKKYLSFFMLRLVTGLQYRTAALAGMVTQFFWGFMEIMVFHAFYEADPAAYPMTMEATASYVWLQQGLLAFFGARMFEGEIFEIIKDGNLAYELCRPIHIYDLWFSRSVAMRLSRAILRCIPILAVAVFLPKGYGLGSPASPQAFSLFVVSLVFGLLVMVALHMLVYVASLFTVSGDGLRILFCSVVEFLSGQILPLPFFPENVKRALELNPFAATGNVPFRIYSGNLEGQEMMRAIAMQYKVSFCMMVIGQFLVSFSVFLGVYFMFQRFPNVKGFTYSEVLLCFSIMLMEFSLAEIWARGFDTFPGMIRQGTFDRVLLRPRSEVLQVLESKFELVRIGKVLQALVMFIYGMTNVEVHWTALKVLTVIFMLAGEIGLFTGLFMIYAALSFFTLEGLEFMNLFTDGAREYGKYPFVVYGKRMLQITTFVIPYALVQYYPLLYLLDRTNHPGFIFLPLLALWFMLQAYALWSYGVRKYQSSGS